MSESGTRGQGSEVRFDNGDYSSANGINAIGKGIIGVQKFVDHRGKDLLVLKLCGPRYGRVTEAFITPQEAVTLGEHLLRAAKDLGARCVWPD